MKQLLKAAHEDVASQFISKESTWLDVGALRRLAVSSAVAIGLAFGHAAPAQAGDGETFGAIIGGAVGTLTGAVATKNQKDYAVRAAAIVATGAMGTWAGKAVGQRIDAPRQDSRPMPARSDGYYEPRTQVREVIVERPVARYPERYEAPRVIERYEAPRQVERYETVGQTAGHSRAYQRTAEPGWETRGQSQGDMLFSPDSSGFNPVLCAALARGNMQFVGSGDKSLSANPAYKSRMAKATDRLLSSAAEYARRIEAWDDAATIIGAEGMAARTRAADSLVAARRDLDSRVVDYAQVRNVLAQQGYNVSDVDGAVIERTSGLTEPNRYVFNDAPSRRPTMR